VLAGHTDEFRVFVDRYQPSIYRFTRALLRNREDACDVTQEVFLAAFVNLSSYSLSRAAFSTWLFTIAHNRCINLLKRKRPSELDERDEVEEVAPRDPLECDELAQRLDRALDALPLEQRSAFVLAEIEELPYSEIARIERTTVGTVKSRIHRAKQRLRSLLETVVKEFT
jgi:RNA polymerase sigma-70 factor (ECF subfamily)